MLNSPALRAVLLIVPALAAAHTGCKDKPSGRATETKEEPPPARRANKIEDYAALCSGGEAYDGAPKLEKKSAASTPSKVAVFRKYVDDKAPAFVLDEHDFGAMGAKQGDVGNVELVACVELKRKEKNGVCRYYGAEVQLYDMTHTVKLVEAATGKLIKEEQFDLDSRTEKCSGSVTGSSYRGLDYSPRLLTLLMPFQPEGVALPKIEQWRLDEVCSGSAFPQAAALPASGPRALHRVYFPVAARSSTREDAPDGLTLPDATGDATTFPVVACVTGKPVKKKASCEFIGGKRLELFDGEFEVALKEARSGKLIETKSFKGSSGLCPSSHKFYDAVDPVITKAEPALAAHLKKASGG